MFFHWSVIVLIPGILLMMWAQAQIRGTYERYSQVQSSLGMTGEEVARAILNKKEFTMFVSNPSRENSPITTIPGRKRCACPQAFSGRRLLLRRRLQLTNAATSCKTSRAISS